MCCILNCIKSAVSLGLAVENNAWGNSCPGNWIIHYNLCQWCCFLSEGVGRGEWRTLWRCGTGMWQSHCASVLQWLRPGGKQPAQQWGPSPGCGYVAGGRGEDGYKISCGEALRWNYFNESHVPFDFFLSVCHKCPTTVYHYVCFDSDLDAWLLK